MTGSWSGPARGWLGVVAGGGALLGVALLATVATAMSPFVHVGLGPSVHTSSGAIPLFTVRQMSPNELHTACVDVTARNSGSNDVVVLAAQGLSGPLGKYLDIQIMAGPADTSTCTTFTGPVIIRTSLDKLAGGLPTGWIPVHSPTWRFKITVWATLKAPYASSATTGFAWRLEGAGQANSTPLPTGKGRPPAVAPAPPAPPNADGSPGGGAPTDIGRVGIGRQDTTVPFIRGLGAAIAALLRHPGYPLLLLTITTVFIVVQDFLDRRDPKLALAPLRNDDLNFTPEPSEVH